MSELQFDGQREGERLEFIFRRHILTARKGVLWLGIMIGLGVVPLLIWPESTDMMIVFFGCVILGLSGAIYSYILWYFSIYIVTNERLRQVSQKGLYRKSVVDLGLDKIQSVSCHVPGVFGGIFGYGTILIQTVAGDLVISMVRKPEKIHNKLQNLVRKA